MSETSHLAQGPPPPSYSESQSYRAVYSPPLQTSDEVSTTNRPIRVERGENARRRFWRAFAIGLAIWMLLAILIDSIEDAFRTKKPVRLRFVLYHVRTPVDSNLFREGVLQRIALHRRMKNHGRQNKTNGYDSHFVWCLHPRVLQNVPGRIVRKSDSLCLYLQSFRSTRMTRFHMDHLSLMLRRVPRLMSKSMW